MALVLLHLSDSHFNRRHATGWDPDEELRHELLADLRRVRNDVGTFSAILISGDVAFSAQIPEYHGFVVELEGAAFVLQKRRRGWLDTWFPWLR